MFYRLARRLRNKKVLKFISRDDSHLDIGCADGFLLLKSPARTEMGITCNAETLLPALKGGYTKITMVAVAEHLDDLPKVLNECLRLLDKDGALIITTPTWLGDLLSPLVSLHDSLEHKRCLTLKSIREAIDEPNKYTIEKKWFEFGLNTLYVIRRTR